MEHPLVSMVNGTPTTSSQLVAETFGKPHKNVLRDIAKICEQLPANFNQLNFEPVNYLDSHGQSRPMYLLTRDAFTLLAMGYTGKEAMAFKVKYIEAFNAMEAELRKQDKPKRKVKPKAVPASKPALPPLPEVFTDGPISIDDVAEVLNMLAYRMEKTCHTMTEQEWKAGTEFFFHAAEAHSPDAVTHFRITNALSATLVGPLFTTRDLIRAAATMAGNAQKMHDIVCDCR